MRDKDNNPVVPEWMMSAATITTVVVIILAFFMVLGTIGSEEIGRGFPGSNFVLLLSTIMLPVALFSYQKIRNDYDTERDRKDNE